MDVKTIGIPPCTGTPGQPLILSENYEQVSDENEESSMDIEV